MCWNVDPALARSSWPHNASCERDIRSLKEASRPSHLQAGFWRKLWPVSVSYTSKVRSFIEPAPVYDHEKGTPVEDQKKGKTKWEVATGHPFLGTI